MQCSNRKLLIVFEDSAQRERTIVLSDNIDSSMLAIKKSLSRYDNYSLLSQYCCKITRNIVTKFI